MWSDHDEQELAKLTYLLFRRNPEGVRWFELMTRKHFYHEPMTAPGDPEYTHQRVGQNDLLVRISAVADLEEQRILNAQRNHGETLS